MTVSERVKQACKERHIPVSKIEQHFGFSNGYIAQMKDEFIPYDRIAKIADYLGTSVQYLMTGEEKNGPVLTEQEKRLLENFRALSENGKRIIEETSKALSDVSGNVHSA